VTANTTTFDSAAVTATERPVGIITVAGQDYEVRCPKLRVWMAMIERQEDYDTGQALKPHILDIYRKLAQSPGDEERAKLIEQYSILQPNFSQAPTALQLAELLLDFLCACMTNKEAAEALRRSYASDEGGCDIPHLRVALDDMDEVFSAWLDDQSDLVGVNRPEPPVPVNRESRRQTARAQKAETTTSGRSAGKKAKRPTEAAR
jgi:hypothetical protein